MFSYYWYNAWRHEEDHQVIGVLRKSLDRVAPGVEVGAVYFFGLRVDALKCGLGPGDACQGHERVEYEWGGSSVSCSHLRAAASGEDDTWHPSPSLILELGFPPPSGCCRRCNDGMSFDGSCHVDSDVVMLLCHGGRDWCRWSGMMFSFSVDVDALKMKQRRSVMMVSAWCRYAAAVLVHGGSKMVAVAGCRFVNVKVVVGAVVMVLLVAATTVHCRKDGAMEVDGTVVRTTNGGSASMESVAVVVVAARVFRRRG
ncbi:hypothetical protein DEO72_LG7g1188 [Vigna unguiculata]|uniref:Uncharacterized protein n=1 Tax=Vigna unguiculata TaxID=3917 RepID=A0A4D6MH86_VIGUN|nr:hypothetical protein DEO72_LG7g1188 [Vigna unguiculata]